MTSFFVLTYLCSLLVIFALTEARSVKSATDGPLVEQCQANSDCDPLGGSCVDGECVCPTGKWLDPSKNVCVKVDDQATGTIKPKSMTAKELAAWVWMVIGLTIIIVFLLPVTVVVLFICGCIWCAWLAACFGYLNIEVPNPKHKKQNQKPDKSTEAKSANTKTELSGGTETGDELVSSESSSK